MPGSLAHAARSAASVLWLMPALAGCVGQPRSTAGASGAPAAVTASAMPSSVDSAVSAPAPPEPFTKLRSQREQAAFVTETTQASRLTVRAAVRTWLSAAAGEGSAAQQFVTDSAELAIVPLLEQPVPSDPARSVQALHALADAESTLRERVAQRIRESLADRRTVPSAARLRDAEVRPEAHRVRDEAYVAMRRLAYFPEPRAPSYLARDRFFEASEARRDATIAAAEKTGDWRTLAPVGNKSSGGRDTLMH